MMTLVFMLEEPSAKEMLKGLLPKVLPESVSVRYQVFEGKQDLQKRVESCLDTGRLPTPDLSSCVIRIRLVA